VTRTVRGGEVAGSAGLTVAPPDGGPLRAWLRRYATTARAIHWN